MKRVLFLCYGNSCRSQMAEGWARLRGKGIVKPASAGLCPLGYITEETERVMTERGADLDGQSSKGLDAIDLTKFDVIVNMSGRRLETELKAFSGRYIEWRVDDPFGEGLTAYRRVRDEIEQQVKALLQEFKKKARPARL